MEVPLTFRFDFNCVDEGIVFDRCERQLEHAVRGGLYVIKGGDDGSVFLVPRDIEVLKKSCAVAVNIEYSASYAAGAAVALSEPAFRKIQFNSVLFACDDGNEVAKVPISLPFE